MRLVLALLCLSASGSSAGAAPVVVELFTSQGCSSCPPADRLLADLGADPDVLLLAFHVDYWDDLGWRDTFSSPRWTARQRRYAQRLGRGVYTPQLVVGGTRDVVGSDRAGARAAIARAAIARAAPPAAAIDLHVEPSGDRLIATGTSRASAEATVVVVLVQGGLETTIQRGENAGLRFRYEHVVRDLAERPAGTFTAELVPPPGAPAATLRVVAFVQAPDGAILAAATTPAATPPARKAAPSP
jgi:hypothetical protein